MVLLHDGRRLTDDKKNLREMGIKEDDVLLVEAAVSNAPAAAAPAAPAAQPEGSRVYYFVTSANSKQSSAY